MKSTRVCSLAKQVRLFSIYIFLAVGFLLNTLGTPAYAHSGGPRITLAKQSVIAGESLLIKGTGFRGVREVTVTLEGIAGKKEAGTFSIDNEDFEIEIDIPMSLDG